MVRLIKLYDSQRFRTLIISYDDYVSYTNTSSSLRLKVSFHHVLGHRIARDIILKLFFGIFNCINNTLIIHAKCYTFTQDAPTGNSIWISS